MSVPLYAGKAALPSCFPPAEFLDALRAQGWQPGPVPETVLFTYARFEHYLASVPDQFTPNHMIGSGPNTFFLVNASDGRLGVNCLPIGAPAAVDQLAKLAALGARRFISIGTAGGLQLESQPGDIVVVTDALRDEGCSYHFLPPADRVEPSAALTTELGATLRAVDVEHQSGATWTTDVPFRETADEVVEFRTRGVMTVEMEAAAVFAAAAYYDVAATSALVVDGVADVSGSNWSVDLAAASTKLRHLFGICVDHFGTE